jgi:hypothetical protein
LSRQDLTCWLSGRGKKREGRSPGTPNIIVEETIRVPEENLPLSPVGFERLLGNRREIRRSENRRFGNGKSKTYPGKQPLLKQEIQAIFRSKPKAGSSFRKVSLFIPLSFPKSRPALMGRGGMGGFVVAYAWSVENLETKTGICL